VIALAEIAIAIAVAFVELLIYLLVAVFSSAYLARHSRGMKRALYGLASISAFHLFLGLTLPIIADFSVYILSPVFSGPIMVVTLVLLLVSIAGVVALDVASGRRAPVRVPSDDVDARIEKQKPQAPFFLPYFLALAIVMGGLSIWVAQYERKTIRQTLCDAASEQISGDWKQRGETLFDLSDRYLKKDLRGAQPCRIDDL